VSWLAVSLVIFYAGAVACFFTRGRPALARLFGPAVTVAASLVGLVACARGVAGIAGALHLPWSMPYGSLSLRMDALSATFAAPILFIAAFAGVYGSAYLRAYEKERDLALSWFFFNTLAGSMLLVVVARNAVLFLLGWELMSLASFFLVIFESATDSVRRAGWTYLIATHIGTAFILVLFALLGREGGSLDFESFNLTDATPALAGAAFILAVIGFGTKAGFMPLHIWLPEAHPAAPSHVSAVMSGVMIKTGVYGLLRALTFLGAPQAWWGWTLVGIGAVSGVVGVVYALAQRDLKRLLAYCSVENVGIIALGLGIGLLGLSYGVPAVAFLGFAGAMLHVINHAVFKSLLFFGAGSVAHAAGTRDIEQLGGLLKRMPVTGGAFLLGSAAICGLPPLNGFVSEFLVYLGSFRALAATPRLPMGLMAAGLVVAGALALIGGFAAVCFTKAFGIAFLGEPRSERAAHAHEAAPAMRISMVTLAAACVAIGLTGPLLLRLLLPAIGQLTGVAIDLSADVAWASAALSRVAFLSLGGVLLVAALAWLRARLLARRVVGAAGTWDCGYLAPAPRMQYTASSFADPVVRLFRFFLRTRQSFSPPEGLFPKSASFSTETPDVYRERMYGPAFAAVEEFLSRFRWLQHGRVNLYVLYIVLALLGLLIWKMR
jgi:hydrogenase-4 component B